MKYAIPPLPLHPVYQLSEATLIGRGNKRDCHVHPVDPNLCIKVARHPEYWQECQEQNIVEWYYTQSLKRRRVPFDHLADCYGWVKTNYGAGLVVERIRNEGGAPALTLRDAISAGTVDISQTHKMLTQLRSWVTKHGVVVADLNGANLMVRQHGGSSSLVFVDGIGSRKANWKFTLYQRYLRLARIKTKRQWLRQEPAMFQVLQKRLSRSKV